jgi:hypothetical protein
LDGSQFDAINLEQVLEHVPDPLVTLDRIKPLCHARTVIRITVPNINRSAEGKRIWQEWPFNGRRMHIMAPFEHLHGFTPDSLSELVRRAQFFALSGATLWSSYPGYVLRKVIGGAIEQLRQTKLLVAKTA